MKTYLIFLNEPKAIVNEYKASSKKDALKMYNDQFCTNYKFKKGGRLLVVERSAWYNYDFRKISYAE
jgi:hypothetical protein